MFQWRRFQFFDKDIVKEESAGALQKLVITCSSSGRGRIVFGDADGFLNLVERDFTSVSSFQAYQLSVTHIQQLKQSNYIVTIGDDEEAISPTIKIWNLDKNDKNGNPLCVRTLKLQAQVATTALAVTEDLTQLAVGLCNEGVILIKGDLLREKNLKQTFIQPEGENPVTGLAFRESSNNSTILFVATSSSVQVYFTQTNNNQYYKEVLDEHNGCGVGCAVLSDEGDLIIGRKEAVYFYEAEGRGPCFAFEGDKKLMSWFRSYLIIVGQDPSNVKFNTFTIYDLKNKFIAYSENRFQNITQVVSEWGSIFVITGDNKIYQLEEKDTQTKLETLFKKNLYLVAINLAHSQNYDYASIIDIFRRYGDHLYSKGDFDGAMTQYLKTIGKLEPSYVIRKFLDAQRIRNLTSYLQALHEKGLANADHTTLLFNCYTKLKDVEKLDEFIKTESLNFEIETAIKACRQAGYHEHALYLAHRHSEHDSYLKILLEDLHKYNEALDYISTLDFFEAEKNLKKYGKTLVTNLPEQTTALLMKLCTTYSPKAASTSSSSNSFSHKLKDENSFSTLDSFSASKVKASPDEFIHIFVTQPDWLSEFLQFMVSKGNASNLVYNTLLELYLRDDMSLLSVHVSIADVDDKSTLITNASSKAENAEEDRKKKKEKAFSMLTDPQAKYDDDHALVLCKMHGFREGLLYLYEKLTLYNEIIQYYMEHNEYENIIKACKKFGDKDPNLWVQVLTYFAKKDEDCQKEITEVLTYVDRDNLLPPLLVIQILSQKPTATLALIKDYICRRLQQESQLITEDYKQIRNYRDETKKMRNEIQELKTSARIFQSHKCTYCTGALDLPAVHFLCMHSFHQRCLGENEGECPVCAPQNKKISEIKRSLEENIGQHDQFFKQLEGAVDGFSTVSDYFGRGVFNKPILLTDK